MVLHGELQQAVKERIIPYNPCDNCRIPPKEKKEISILPPEKVGAYLREAEKYGVLPMFMLELTSNLRRGELLALLWDDLDAKNCILSVSKQVTRSDGGLVVTEPKTKNSVRKVAISKQTMTNFKPYVGRKRKSGTGCITEINDHLFEGRYSPKWPDGKKHSRNVYAHTREECDEKLKVLIAQMKVEISEAKRQKVEGEAQPQASEDKQGKKRSKASKK